MVDVDARLAEIAEMVIRWMAVDDGRRSTIPATPDDVLWLLAVLKEQAEQIERLQRETNETFVSVEARALGLLRAIAEEAESLNHHLAVHGPRACNGVRTRVQNIHGLAVTPEVEEWHAERSDEVASTASSASASEASRLLTERDAEARAIRYIAAHVPSHCDCEACGESPEPPNEAFARIAAALVARDAELAEQADSIARLARAFEAAEAEVTQLRAALETVLDCRGDYLGTVSRRGGYPAICLACVNKAREALAGVVPTEQAT